MTAKALRQSVLQRAIQGKLVPQDPSDEPASVLLEKIKEEKKAANDKSYVDSCIYKGADEKFYEKVGKAEKDITDEIPFDIPDSWEWTRISTYTQKVTDYVASGSFASLRENVKYYKTENYALLVKTQDFSNGFTKNLTYTDEHGYNFLNNSNLFGGELILSNVGSIGKVFIVPELNRPATLAPNAIMVRCYDSKQVPWLYNVFLSDFGKKTLLKISSATAIAKFNKTGFKTLLVPIPPIAEQQRIVEALDKIYPLLDEYERLEKESSRLDGEICDKLRNSILQYAMQGKLVPQDPSDETAFVLLERIKSEQEKTHGKDYVDSVIYGSDDSRFYERVGNKEKDITDDIPFKIPGNWKWVHPEDIGFFSAGYTPKKETLCASGKYPYFKVADMNKVGNEKYLHITASYLPESYLGRLFFANTIVFPKNGGAVFTNKKRILSCDSLVDLNTGTYTPYKNVNLEYVFLLFQTIDFKKFYKGTALPTIDFDSVKKIYWPLPPLAEQRRIVEAVYKAFAQIDALEAAIKNSGLA